jgi:hypothetical protein
MRNHTTVFLWGSLALVSLVSAPAHAQFVTPANYSYSNPPEGTAQGGSFNYFDESGVQLIDSILGDNNWAADLGNGPAFEWVGWINANPTITFNFAGQVNITEFQIGLNNFGGGGVTPPTSITIDGIVHNLTGSEIPAGQRGFVNFSQAFSGTTVQILLSDSGSGNWIFTDEIRFRGTASATAPEPTTLALFGLGAGIGYVRRRRRAL